MAVQVAEFVSKRLQRAFLALLCLTLAQFALAAAGRADTAPSATVRVHITPMS